MQSVKLLTVVGARPQFIKAAVISREIRQRGGDVMRVDERIVHTGQHFDENMSAVFFRELDIPRPHVDLGLGGGSHGRMTGRMLEAIERMIEQERPDWVLVYGDTNSTLAGALAAVKLHVPVAHVEAGLRSFNRRMPEETNRVLTDHASDLLFAPTETAVANLKREGIDEARTQRVGDVMYDAMLFYRALAAEQSRILERLNLADRAFILATVHRAENTDDPVRLRAILRGLAALVDRFDVVLPLHPRTRERIDQLDDGAALLQPLRVIDPVGYLDMVRLESAAALIATDSGGVQKEAFFHCVPCVTLRDETEWVELVEAGANRLAGADAHAIVRAADEALAAGVRDAPLYGDGYAGRHIVEALTRFMDRQGAEEAREAAAAAAH